MALLVRAVVAIFFAGHATAIGASDECPLDAELACTLADSSCPANFTIHQEEGWTGKASDIIISTNVAAYEDCCAVCAQHEECVAWTWSSSSNKCFIARAATKSKSGKNKVSGTRSPSPTPPPRPPSPTPPPQPPKPPLGVQPNILFLFPDEWRFDWDGFRTDNGTVPLNMPNMKKFAKLGTRFLHAYVPSPLCAPSRAALAAGREYDYAGVPGNFNNDYPISQATFYTQLQKVGYHTMMTGKDDLTKKTQLGSRIGKYLPYGAYHMAEIGISDGIRHSGKADVIDKWPIPHEAYGYFLNNQTVTLESGKNITAWEAHHSCMKDRKLCDSTSFPDEVYEDNWVSSNAVELLERKPSGKPWFMHISFPGPHPPFLVTSRMADSVTNRTWPQPVDMTKPDVCPNSNAPGEPANGNRCNYGAEIENLDRLFGVLVDKVEALGELERTIVCICSDHGEMLGDHGGSGKSKPWEASASVPLLCFGGSPSLKIKAGAVVSHPVATLDLAGTFIDYAGGQLADKMTTKSLRPILQGDDTSVRPFVASGLGKWRLVVQQHNGTWLKFICCKGKCPNSPSNVPKPTSGWTQLLYEIDADQFDMNDVSAKYPDAVTSMRKLLPESFGCGSSAPADEDSELVV